MKKKAILALTLILALFISLFAACASDTSEDPDSAPVVDPGVESDPDALSQVNVWYFVSNGFCNDITPVQEAVNAITEKEIGVHVTLQVSEIGNYLQQAPLSLAAGDPVDIFERGFGALGFATLYANGQMLDLTDLLDEYGKELKDLLGPYLGAVSVDGAIYGVPPYRLYGASIYVCMRSDVLRELGLYEKAQNMTTWAEYEEIMAAVKENYDSLWPMAMTNDTESAILAGDTFADAYSYDSCGDTSRIVGAFDGGTIQSILDREGKVEWFERLADWYLKGWVWPDSAFSDQMSSDLVKQNVAFSEVVLSEFGVESLKLASTGYEMLCVEVLPVEIGTGQVQKFGFSINQNCEDPVAAVKFLNLLYTNKDLANLMSWGVEGQDYEIVDGVAQYVDNNKDTANYHADDYSFGNQFLVHPWSGSSADFREQAQQKLADFETSPFLGFTFAPEGLDTEVATISAAYDEFMPLLSTGSYTPESLEQAKQKLDAAGLPAYIEQMQQQLDAWLATNES